MRKKAGVTKGSEKRIKAAERQAKALELRKMGIHYEQIAQHLGYASASGAHKAVHAALSELVREPAKEYRTLLLERYEKLYRLAMEQAMAGKIPGILAASDVLGKIAKLEGLDAPLKLAGADGGPLTFTDLMNRVLTEGLPTRPGGSKHE